MKKALARIKINLGTVAFALVVLLGAYAFVSMGCALGEAVGAAYSAPVDLE